MSSQNSLVVGDPGERGEELDGHLSWGDARCNGIGGRQESRLGVYLCPEANQNCFIRPIQDDGDFGGLEEALSGWNLLPGRGPEERESCLHEIREQDCLLPAATCDFLRKL